MVAPDPLPSVPRPRDEPDRCPDTETTRLLCAGTYLSARFRRQVANLLVTHDERALAPAVGVDVFAVLAHARQAKRLERRTGVWVVLMWALFAISLVINAWGRYKGGLLVAPAIALLFVMNIFPLMWSLGLSIFSYRANRMRARVFVGLGE